MKRRFESRSKAAHTNANFARNPTTDEVLFIALLVNVVWWLPAGKAQQNQLEYTVFSEARVSATNLSGVQSCAALFDSGFPFSFPQNTKRVVRAQVRKCYDVRFLPDERIRRAYNGKLHACFGREGP